MMKFIALVILTVGSMFGQSNEVFGSVGLSFPRTPAITSTFSASAGVGHTVLDETFGSTELIGTYSLTRQTPKGGIHSFLGGVKQNFSSSLVKNAVPYLSFQVGEATLLKNTGFASQVGGGVSFVNLCPKGYALNIGITGTKVESIPMYSGVSVGISKRF